MEKHLVVHFSLENASCVFSLVKQGTTACLWFQQIWAFRHGQCLRLCSCFCRAVLNLGLFVSVSLGCLMQLCFCDGWLQCFLNQEWGLGLLPMGIHLGGVLVNFSNLLCHDLHIEPLHLAIPWSTYLSTCHSFISSHYKDNSTSALQTVRGHENKSNPIANPHAQHEARTFVYQCLVCRCLCYTTLKYLHRQAKENIFFLLQ